MKENCFSAKRLENFLGLGKGTPREKEAKRVGEDKQMFRESQGG